MKLELELGSVRAYLFELGLGSRVKPKARARLELFSEQPRMNKKIGSSSLQRAKARLELSSPMLHPYLEPSFLQTDFVCTLQVLNQEETPLLYSLVFGDGVVNDATSVVLFNAITKFDLSDMNTYLEAITISN
ncbi:putative cation/H+ exchanger, CPA1 family, na+/H+ exchanger [Helianthus anomalus]